MRFVRLYAPVIVLLAWAFIAAAGAALDAAMLVLLGAAIAIHTRELRREHSTRYHNRCR